MNKVPRPTTRLLKKEGDFKKSVQQYLNIELVKTFSGFCEKSLDKKKRRFILGERKV